MLLKHYKAAQKCAGNRAAGDAARSRRVTMCGRLGERQCVEVQGHVALDPEEHGRAGRPQRLPGGGKGATYAVDIHAACRGVKPSI